MVVENTGLVAVMGRSRRIIEGRWWSTFLILFLVLLIWYVVQVALGGFLSLASGLLGIVVSQYVALAISQAVAVLVSALAVPVFQLAIGLLYFHLRVRPGALDLCQLPQPVAAPPRADDAPE